MRLTNIRRRTERTYISGKDICSVKRSGSDTEG